MTEREAEFADDDGPPRSPTRRRVLRLAAFAVGAALLAGAIWTAGRMGSDIPQLRAALFAADRSTLVLLAALPLVNCALTTLVFKVLTHRFGDVGLREMLALIGSGWLLNYLPAGSGLVGRAIYHRYINGIRLRDSARVAGESIVLGLLAAGTLIAFIVAPRFIGEAGAWALGGLIVLTLMGITARPFGAGGAFAIAYLTKMIDAQVWAWRYAMLFSLVNLPLSPTQAVLFATLSQLATMVPFLGNGLGLREWLIGLAAVALPSGVQFSLGGGLTVELLNRAAELLAALLVGIPGAIWVSRRVASGHARHPHQPSARTPGRPDEPATPAGSAPGDAQ